MMIGTDEEVRMKRARVETGFAGHHHVEDQQVEMQAEQFGTRRRWRSSRW